MTRERPTTLLVTYNFPPQIGGIETLMYDIMRNFPGDRLVLAPWTPHCEEFDSRQEFRVVRVKSPENTLLRTACFLTKSVALVKKERPAHIQSANIFAGLVSRNLNLVFGIPYSVYAMGKEILILNSSLRTPVYRGIFKSVLAGACKILSISDFTTGELIKFGIDPNKIHKIPSGIDTTKLDNIDDSDVEKLRERLGGIEGRKILLTIARLVPRKGHDQVIRAVKILAAEMPDLLYLIAGSGPELQNLKNLVAELGVSNHVRFLGRVPDSDIPLLYRMADVFILASRLIAETADVEGFGQVFLEANYCGLPVIGGRSGGIPDSVDDGRSGFLVNPENPADIAQKLKRLMTDPELRRKFGEYGRERVIKSFAHETTVQSILSGLRECQ